MWPAWLHDLDPVIWRISGDFALRWYGLSYAVGFLLAWLVLRQLASRGALCIPRDRVADAVLIVAFGVVVGGRLGYILFYQPSLLVNFSGSFPFWGVLAINKGGMASHGGMLGVIAASWFVARGFKDAGGERLGAVPTLHIVDAMALVAPLGVFLGRCANFVNGELLGRVASRFGEPAPWWAVKYPQEIAERWDELPIEQREQLFAQAGMPPGLLESEDAVELYMDKIYPVIIEGVREGDKAMIEAIEPLINARHPSQIYQAIGEGLIVLAVLWVIARKPRTPGLLSAWFLITYGVFRVLTEFYRLPDANLATQRIAGLSRGQWLSVVMIVAGSALLALVIRRGACKMGGWLRPADCLGAATNAGAAPSAKSPARR